MREEIEKIVADQIRGMADELAQQITESVLALLKAKLPPALAPVVDGKPPDLSQIGPELQGEISNALGGMLGNILRRQNG